MHGRGRRACVGPGKSYAMREGGPRASCQGRPAQSTHARARALGWAHAEWKNTQRERGGYDARALGEGRPPAPGSRARAGPTRARRSRPTLCGKTTQCARASGRRRPAQSTHARAGPGLILGRKTRCANRGAGRCARVGPGGCPTWAGPARARRARPIRGEQKNRMREKVASRARQAGAVLCREPMRGRGALVGPGPSWWNNTMREKGGGVARASGRGRPAVQREPARGRVRRTRAWPGPSCSEKHSAREGR